MGDANKYREKNPFHDYDKKWLSKNLDKKWRNFPSLISEIQKFCTTFPSHIFLYLYVRAYKYQKKYTKTLVRPLWGGYD